MRTPVPEYLSKVLRDCADNSAGELADYIPQLAQADPEPLAVAICMADGTVYSAGDDTVEFTIQSAAKPFVYAMALRDSGPEKVLSKVGVEPSGEAFNELSLGTDGRPDNPMINSGAIATMELVGSPDLTLEERSRLIIQGHGEFLGRELEVDEAVFQSEFDTSFRNRGHANLLRSFGIIDSDPRDLVREYTRQSSLKVNVRDLATMAATLAMGGRNPVTGKQVVPNSVARQVMSVMMTCGMYDTAGDWMTGVGIPAKSGVSGGLFGAMPGQAGVAAFSPKLDRWGHSVRAVRVFQQLSRDLNLHLMDVQEARVRLLLSSVEVELDDGTARHLRLQGALYFGSVERLLREIDGAPEEETVIVDMTKVTNVNPIGRKMLLDGMARLQEEHRLVLVDPNGILANPRATGVEMDVVKELDEDA